MKKERKPTSEAPKKEKKKRAPNTKPNGDPCDKPRAPTTTSSMYNTKHYARYNIKRPNNPPNNNERFRSYAQYDNYVLFTRD